MRVHVTIEGFVGEFDIERFTELPSFQGWEAPWVLGGVIRRNGSVSVSMPDLLDEMAPDISPVDEVTSEMSPSATALTTVTPDVYTNGTFLYIAGEALLVVGPSTVQRGALGTTPQTLRVGADVYLWNPWVEGRVARLFLDDVLFSEYIVQAVDVDQTLNAYVFDLTERDSFARRVPRSPESIRLDQSATLQAQPVGSTILGLRGEGRFQVFGSDFAVFRAGDELLLYRNLPQGNRVGLVQRRFADTTEENFDPTARLFRVLSVENGDFRADKNGVRRVETWVDILLCLMTSSPFVDGPTNNFVSGGFNYSLCPGYGAGIPASRIDFPSFYSVAQGPANFPLPEYLLESDARSFGDIADELLKPTGCVLTEKEGLVYLIDMTAPKAVQSFEVTVDSLVQTDRPDISVSRSPLRAVECEVNVHGESYRQTLGDLLDLADPFDVLAIDGDMISLDVSGGNPRDETLYRRIGVAVLERAGRPYPILTVMLRPEAVRWKPGDVVSVNLAFPPNYAGGRGFNTVGFVTALEPSFEPGRTMVEVTIRLAQPVSDRLIAPSARVLSVSFNEVEVDENLYTADNVQGITNNDADTFAAGDIVRLVNASGVPFTGTQTVVSAINPFVELNGNFGGNLAVDTVLVFSGGPRLSRYARFGQGRFA